jgi:hypothetical protein
MFDNENYPNSDMEVPEKSARKSRILAIILLVVILVWIFLEIRTNEIQSSRVESSETQSVPKYFLHYFNPGSTTKVLTDPDYCEKMRSTSDTVKAEKEIYFILNSKVAPFYFDTVFGFNPVCGDYKNPKYIEGVRDGNVVRFYDREVGPACYFYSDLTHNPAKTSRWYYNSFGTYKTLSEGIISCTGTSRVWKKKFDDMIAHDVVDVSRMKQMSSQEISVALYREYEYANSGKVISEDEASEEMNNIGY